MSDEEDESRPGSLSQSFKDQNPLSDLISADKEGWLEKRGEKNTAWKKRWFVLKNNRLLYYKKKEHVDRRDPQGEIPLEGCSVEFVPESKHDRKFCFELHSPHTTRIFVMAAESGTVMQDWLGEVRKAMLRIRRSRAGNKPTPRVSILLAEEEQKAFERQRLSHSGAKGGAADQIAAAVAATQAAVAASAAPQSQPSQPSGGAPTASSLAPPQGSSNRDRPRGSVRFNDRVIRIDEDVHRPPSRSEFKARMDLAGAGAGGNFVLPNGEESHPDATVEDKYEMYLKFLSDTQQQRRRGTVAERPVEFTPHHTLLHENEKKTNPCADCCTVA